MGNKPEDFSKELLIDVKLKADKLKSELPHVLSMLSSLQQQQQILIARNQQGSDEFKKNAESISKYGQQLKNTNKFVDDYKKALKHQNDSITQNAALLELLKGAYQNSGEAKKKDAEQIIRLNSHLEQQQGELKKTTSKTVEYATAIAEAGKKGIDSLPGGEHLTALLGSLAKGFNITGKLAGDTAEALEGTGKAASAAGGPFTIIIQVVTMLVGWLMKFSPISEAVARIWTGLTSAFDAFANTVKNFSGFTSLITNMKQAYIEGEKLERKIQDLQRSTAIHEVSGSAAETKIAELEMKMKNAITTQEQKAALLDQIHQMKTKKYVQALSDANTAYNIAVDKILTGSTFNDKQKKMLRDYGVAYAIQLDKDLGLKNGKEKIEELKSAQLKINEVQKAWVQDRAARQDQKQQDEEERRKKLADEAQERKQRADQARADHEKAVEAGKKAAETRAKGREAERKANEEQEQSVKRMLELKMSDFAKKLSGTDEHYRQMEREQRNFIETYNNMKGAERIANEKAYRISLKNIEQLHKEHYAVRMKQITDFNRDMADHVQAADNELANLKIANIADSHEREIAESKQQEKEKLEDLSKRHKEDFDKQTKLEDDLARLKANAANYKTAADKEQYAKELAALQEHVDKQKHIVQTHVDAKKEIETKFRTERENSQKEYDKNTQAKAGNTELDKLNADVTEKGKKAKPFLGDKDLLAAQEKAVAKKFDLEIEAAKAAGQSTVALELQKETELHKLHEDFAKKREELAIGTAKKVAEKGFSMLKNSIKSASEARLKSLDEDKNRELANTSLTSAQKKAVEEKYKKKQLEEKVKAFRAEQKASIAQALINGALAMTKVASQSGLLSFAFSPLIAAQTAVAVATIMRQKPPAYALGGVHGRRYSSDGRGGVLPGYSRYDNVNAFLRDGEGIVVSEAMRNPYARQMVSDINQSFGGRAFAAGGIYSNSQYLPTTSNPARMQPVINANIDYGKLAAAMASMPAPIMDIKDVNTQQQRLAQSESRANL